MSDHSRSGIRLSQVNIFVHLSHGLDERSYRAGYFTGIEPDESPYGFHLARDLGFKGVSLSKDKKGNVLVEFFRRVFRRVFGFDVIHALCNREDIANADMIWVMTEHEAFAIMILRRLKLVKPVPIIANAVWLLNDWDRLGTIRKAFLTLLLRDINVLTVHSAECLPIAKRAFPTRNSRLMYFGINKGLFSGEPEGYRKAVVGARIKIFSAGNDRTRDWYTLLAAVGNDDRFEVTILCQWLSSDLEAQYVNLTVIRDRRVDTLLECYKKTDFVVLTMYPNYFSGITVALEAVAMAKPLVCTRTGGIPTYFSDNDVMFVDPNNSEMLKEKILASTIDERTSKIESSTKRFQALELDTCGLVRRYAEITKEVLRISEPG